MSQSLDQLRFPIGKFNYQDSSDQSDINRWINTIRLLPENLSKTVSKLNDVQLNTPYRPEGWSIRQVVHHLADSHINSFIRYKLALTEQNPTIKPYEEADWAKLPDSMELPVQVSLDLLKAVHTRWVYLLEHMNELDYKRTFFHPESQITYDLKRITALYAWHSEHHLAHIVNLIQSKNW